MALHSGRRLIGALFDGALFGRQVLLAVAPVLRQYIFTDDLPTPGADADPIVIVRQVSSEGNLVFSSLVSIEDWKIEAYRIDVLIVGL